MGVVLKGTRISFDGRGSDEFLPLRSTNSKPTHVILCHILSAQYPERYRNSSNDGHFRF